MIRSRNRIKRGEYEAQNTMSLATAARVTAELVNVVGAFGAGKKWKPVRPAQYFDAWTGTESVRPSSDTIQKIESGIEEQIKAREAAVLARRRAAAKQVTETAAKQDGASEQSQTETHAQE